MRILVYGTEKFDDYSTFMRGLVVAIDDHTNPSDTKIEVFTAGPHKLNNFTAEFINKTEGFFKQKNIKTRFTRVKKSDIIDKFEDYDFDHIVSFGSKSDQRFFDTILDKAETNNISASYYKI
jgi:hypothetical protein